MLVCAPYYHYLLYPIYQRWDLLYSGTTMELPKNIPITSQWDFSYSGSELRGKHSPSRSLGNAALQMRYSPLKNKCESNSVVEISPTRRNSLQVTQMEFHPLGSPTSFFPIIPEHFQSKTRESWSTLHADNQFQTSQQSNKSNNLTNSIQARSKWFYSYI